MRGNPLTTDQRGDGFPRIAGGVVDLGALEASSHYLYIVNSPGDTIAEDGLLTLREAIEAISTGTQVGDAPAPIQLSGDYPLFIRFDDAILGQTITLAQGDLDITESVWIQGPGAELLTIDAGGEDRAFAVQEAGNVWISGLTIENGASGSNQGGGGIWAYDTDFRLTDMVVRQCGSHAVSVGCGTLSLADSTFLNNPNGAIIVRGNADDPSSSHNIVNCLFDNNGTGWNRGGAVYSVDASVLIVNSRLQGNRTEYGGAVYTASGEVEIVNSAFTGNTAERGGAVYGDANATITITNSTLAGNAASEGAGIYMYGDGDLKLQSSILFHDGQTEVVYDDGQYAVEDMLIGIDPHFVRNPSDGGDGWGDNPQTPSIDESANDDYGDLRLRVDSPARDEGDNDLLPADTFDLDADGDVSETLPVDLAGTTRIQGGTVDIGAYEFFAPTVPGDLNVDDVVNSADLDLIRAHWLESVTPGDTFSGDANGDGTVNSADLDFVRVNWSPATQAAAADAIFAGAADETQAAVYGPVPKEAIANNARRQFASLADFLWEKPSISVKKLAFGAPYRS